MKQAEYREPNTRCFDCASPYPKTVIQQREGDYTEFICESCDDTVLSRITTTSNQAQYPHHLWIPGQLMSQIAEIPSDRASQTDIYWTRKEWSIVINGRHIHGDQRVTDLAIHLESL